RAAAGTRSLSLPAALPILGAVCRDQRAIAAGLELELLAGDQDLARVGGLQQVDATQQGAFAGAGRTEDGNHVAITGNQSNTREYLQITIALVQVAHFESRGGHVSLSMLKQLGKTSTAAGFDQDAVIASRPTPRRTWVPAPDGGRLVGQPSPMAADMG